MEQNNQTDQQPVVPVSDISNAGSTQTPPQVTTAPPTSDNQSGQKPQPQTPVKPRIDLKRPPLLWEKTQSIISDIEIELQGKIVTYFVIPGGAMAQDDVKYFYSHLKRIGRQQKLHFAIISGGGDGMSAWRTASLLRTYCETLSLVIPERAASAATILCLAADELIMTPLSYLTAVDTSITHPLNPKGPDNKPVSMELEQVKRAINVLKQDNEKVDSVELYKTIFNYIHPVALGSVERTKTLSENLCSDVMDLKNVKSDEDTKKKIIDKLNTGYPSHGYPIPRHKAKELGLNVLNASDRLADLLWDLSNTYRYLTEPVRTDLNESSIHTEQIYKVLESQGSRFSLHNNFDRRLDPVLKAWTTLKDEFRWRSMYMREENGTSKLTESFLDF